MPTLPDAVRSSTRPARSTASPIAFWEAILEESPSTATMYGDSRYDDRLEDPGPAGRARARALAESTLAAASAIDADDQPLEDRITLDMVQVVCQLQIDQDDQRVDLLRPVDQMAGPQTLLPTLATFQEADTPEKLDRFIDRLRAYPAYMAANIELLREGISSGLTAPRIVTERTIAQLERLLAIPADESVIVTMARVAGEDERNRVLEAVRSDVIPADQAFLDALRGEYLKASREDPGLWSAPNGEALYRTQILAWTTLPLEPADAAPDRPRRARANRGGAQGDRPLRRASATIRSAYRAHLASDPANRPGTPDELLGRAREDIGRAMDLAPRYFGTLPKSGCEVRAVEEYKEKDSPFAYYQPPTTDGSRPGYYYANTYDLRVADVLEAGQHDLPRGRPRPPLPDRAGDGERGPDHVPAARLAPRRRGVCRGLGPVLGAPGRRDGALPQRGRAVRDARRDGLAGRPAGRPTPGSTPCAGRASARSTSCAGPGCPRPMP